MWYSLNICIKCVTQMVMGVKLMVHQKMFENEDVNNKPNDSTYYVNANTACNTDVASHTPALMYTFNPNFSSVLHYREGYNT